MNIVEHVFLLPAGSSSGYMPRRGIAGSSGSIMSNFLRNLQTDFQSGCTSLQSHQQWSSVPLSPHPCQHLLSPEFLILAILTGVRCNLRLFWFAFLWWLRMLNIFSGASQPFGIPQVRTVCLTLYPISNRGFGSLESNFLSSLYLLDISPLLDAGLVIFFSYSFGCCFVLLTVAFALQKLFSLLRSHLSFITCWS